MNMQFYTNYSNNTNNNSNNNSNNQVFINNLSFDKKLLSRMTKSNSIVINNLNDSKIVQNNNTIDNSKSLENTKTRWGPSIWFLFHTLAEKIKEEKFASLKDELLDIIKGICMNLPCPDCSNHATQYIQKLNYVSIKNKDDLKIFLFNFHNHVNIRKGIKIFSLDELKSKYPNSNTINIINNFISVYQYKNKNFNMIANEIQRQRQLDIFKLWIKQNIQSFQL
jgi:hypothetical protein